MNKITREVINLAYKINDIVHKNIELGKFIDDIEHRLGEYTYIRNEKNIKAIIDILIKVRNGYMDEMIELLGERNEKE